MDSYDEYEKAAEANEKRNEEFLKLFSDDLHKNGLTEKTIQRHLFNADFYLNTYLVRMDVLPMEKGTSGFYLSDFLGYFFIRKCMWSTPGSIKSTAASLKKFYKCMLSHGKITHDQYDELTDTIRNEMDEWQEECALYNDPNSINPFSIM